MKTIFSLAFISFFLGLQSQEVEFPQVAGWERTKKIKHYNADSLWTLIDGAADAFLQFDYVEMQRVEYTQNDSVYFEVHAYVYANNESAFGIYSNERPEDAKITDLGAQGYSDPNMINFLTGKYYFKMYSNTPGTEAQSAMRMVAYSLSKHIDPAPVLPEIIKSFPAENKINNSEQLLAKNFLGYSFFKYVYQARYKEGKNECYMFIIQQKSEEEINSILVQFCTALKTKVPKNTQEIMKFKDPNNGVIFLIKKGSILQGVYNVGKKETVEYLLK
jgi:hypothetical protein